VPGDGPEAGNGRHDGVEDEGEAEDERDEAHAPWERRVAVNGGQVCRHIEKTQGKIYDQAEDLSLPILIHARTCSVFVTPLRSSEKDLEINVSPIFSSLTLNICMI
jgi:hypothetical protein